MKVIISRRGGGKTTQLIEWLQGDPQRVLITFSVSEMKRLVGLYPDLAHRICTWDEYRERRGIVWRANIKEVAIDNADIILQGQARDSIKLITISDE